jgi:hypothetical protein
VLSLSRRRIDPEVTDLRPLAACKHLSRLDMVHTVVSDLSPLAECDALTWLDIEQNDLLSSSSSTYAHFYDADHGEEDYERRYVHPDLPGVVFDFDAIDASTDSDLERECFNPTVLIEARIERWWRRCLAAVEQQQPVDV